MALSKALSLLHFQKKTMKKTYKIYGATNAFWTYMRFLKKIVFTL